MIRFIAHTGLPTARINVPEGSNLVGGEFGYPILSAMTESIMSKANENGINGIEVITLGPEGADVECVMNDPYMKSEILSKYKIGFMNISLTGEIGDQMSDLYNYLVDSTNYDDSIVIDVSFCNRYIKTALIMAAQRLLLDKNVSYMIINSNQTCNVVEETDKYANSFIEPVIEMLNETGLIKGGIL